MLLAIQDDEEVSVATVEDFEQSIIDLLAAQKKCSPDEYRADLEAKDSDMPEDSHRLVRVVFRLQQEYGLSEIEWDKSLKPAFKSVRALAALLHSRQTRVESIT